MSKIPQFSIFVDFVLSQNHEFWRENSKYPGKHSIAKNHWVSLKNSKLQFFQFLWKLNFLDTILEFLTVWKGKEGQNGVKYRKEAILVTYEMIDIVDAMTRFVAQPTQDIRVQNCKKRKNWRKFWIFTVLDRCIYLRWVHWKAKFTMRLLWSAWKKLHDFST